MNEPIINGIDLSKYFKNHYDSWGRLYCIEYKGNPLELQNAIKRLQEENEELKEKVKNYKLYGSSTVVQPCNHTNIEYDLLILENEELKKKNKELLNLSNKGGALLVAESTKNKKYKQALEEIRSYCDEQNLKADYTACYITNRIDEVLNDRD